MLRIWGLPVERTATFQASYSANRRMLKVAQVSSPEQLVRSLGRISRHGLGQNGNTRSLIFLEEYTTQRWCVINQPWGDSRDSIE